MEFDFDTPIDRRGSDSVKWAKYAGRDVLPMWVADMDFAAPPAAMAALHRRVDHGVFGYGTTPPSMVEATVEALERDHGWCVEPGWLVWLPGLVTGLNVACRAVGEPGDAVFTATPIYPPFLSAPGNSGRKLVTAPLVLNDGSWQWDFARVEAAIDARTRLFMLCNPHNPVGRVFTRSELQEVVRIAERHDLVICSDEIHAGLVLDAACTHLPIATLAPEVARRTITLMAPSKTYNIPGLGCAFAVISEARLRHRFLDAMRGIVPHVNVLGFAAAEAAYRFGQHWHQALIAYLRGNAELTVRSIGALPGLRTSAVQASYLAWIDATALGPDDPAAFFEAAGVGLSSGSDFSAPGFVRLNFGCPRSLVVEALRRMSVAVTGISD